MYSNYVRTEFYRASYYLKTCNVLDALIFSSSVIPGNERTVQRVKDKSAQERRNKNAGYYISKTNKLSKKDLPQKL